MADTQEQRQLGAGSSAPEGQTEPAKAAFASEAAAKADEDLLLPGPARPLVNFVARIRAGVLAKLLGGFLLGAFLLLAMGILSLIVINRMDDRAGELSDLQDQVDQSRQAIYLVTAQSHYRAMALLTGDDTWNDKIVAAKEEFRRQLKALELARPAGQDELLASLRAADDRFSGSSQRVQELYDAGRIDDALTLHIAEEHQVSHELEDGLNRLIADSEADIANARAAFTSDRNVLAIIVAAVSGVSLLLALALGLVLSWAFVRPVRIMDRALAKIARGDFSQRVAVPNRDEFGTLSANLNSMTGQLATLYADLESLNATLQKRVDEQVEELAREGQELERIDHELQVARDIQLAFLPKGPPEIGGWRLKAYYQPARAVGGDFYDFIDFPGKEGFEGLVVGDVSDKGVPAALVMCATRSMLRAAAQRLDSPGAVLETLNELLYRDIPANMFVTCLYAVLDTRSGTLRYANAGHNLPYHRTESGAVELRATGMPLGLMPDMSYEEKTVSLAPGDSILLHSDGLVEAHSPSGEMFGFPRLWSLVGKHPAGDGIIDILLSELSAFTGANWEQEDDVTLVSIQRSPSTSKRDMRPRPDTSSAQPARVVADFTVASEPGNEKEAMERVAEAVQELQLSPARLERLKTAVAEATMNGMEHGNLYRPDLPVSVRVTASPAALSVQITDHGTGQPIPDARTPDLEAKLAGVQTTRGWGLFLIRNMVDEVRIDTDAEHHTVELTLWLEGDGGASGQL